MADRHERGSRSDPPRCALRDRLARGTSSRHAARLPHSSARQEARRFGYVDRIVAPSGRGGRGAQRSPERLLAFDMPSFTTATKLRVNALHAVPRSADARAGGRRLTLIG